MLRRLLLTLWYACTALVVLAALGLSLGRLALPLLETRSGQLEALIEQVIGQDVEIGRLELSWYGLGPEVRIHDFALPDAQRTQPSLRAHELRVAFNVVKSLWAWRPVASRFVVLGSELSLQRNADGHFAVQGVQLKASRVSPLLMVLAQPHVELRDIRVHWKDARGEIPDLVLSNISLYLRNSGDRHQLQVDLQLPAEYGTHLQLMADLRGAAQTFENWRGTMYVSFGQVSVARWLAPEMSTDWRMSGTADAALWATLNGGALQSLRGSFSIEQPSIVRTDIQVPAFSAERISTRLDWRREDTEKVTGWILNLADSKIDLAGQPGMRTALTLVQSARDDGTSQLQLAADQVQIDARMPLLTQHPALSEEQRSILQRLQLAGTLRDVRLDVTRRADGRLDTLVYRLQLQDILSAAVDRLPGVTALSGRLFGDLQRGQLDIDSHDAQLDLPKLFRDPLQLAQLNGRIDWRQSDDRLHIESTALRVDNADIRTLSRLRLDIPNDGSKPFLDMQTSFTDGNVEATRKYLPVGIMPPRTVEWLDRALVSGRLHDGAVLFHGRLGAFPFDHADGRLEVRATVSDGVLDYREGWHRIEGLEAELTFINRGMHIRGVAGKILGSELPEVSVRIDDLAHARLDIDGRATGTLADMLRFLRDSPLSEGRREALASLQASGDAQLQLAIRLPLGKTVAGTLEVDGRVQLPDNRLDLQDWELALEQIKGDLHFTQDGIDGRDLRARLMGAAVTIDVGDAPSSDIPGGEAMTRVRAIGKLPLLERLRKAQPRLELISGNTDWTAALYLPKRSQAGAAAAVAPARVELRSELRGIKIDLPEPFAKTAASTSAFALTAELQGQGRGLGPLRLHYGNHSAAFALTRSKTERGALQLARGELKFGAADAALPDVDGVRIAGRLPVFAWDAWRDLLDGGEPTGLLRALDVDIGSLNAFDRGFSDVQIRAQREAGYWTATLGGPDIEGTLELPPQRPVLLRCTRLRIPAAAEADGTRDTVKARLDPAGVPPLDLDVQQLQFDDLALGHLKLKTHPLAAGLAVDSLQVEADWIRLGAQGEWTLRDAQEASRFHIDIQGGELGKMLTAFGSAGNVAGGETQGTIDANWSGSPAEFALAKLAGRVEVKIGKGQLLNVEAGAGRLLGLLNIAGLRRRLTLDFSDVFAKGFGFDSITGTLSLRDGDAYTDDLVIDGPAARIEVSGRTGLAKRDYDQLVTVIPQTQSTLPLAGAIAGGPAVGAALLLADKLLGRQLEGLTRFTRYQYTVTGSWDEPTFTPVSSGAARGLQDQPLDEPTPVTPAVPEAAPKAMPEAAPEADKPTQD